MEYPELIPVPLKDKYELVKDYIYSYNGGHEVVIPSGFQYDGASIPVIAQPLTYTPFHPKVMTAALVHDWLYSTGELERLMADSIFYQLLIDSDVPRVTAELMYAGVRAGGSSHYKKEE